MNDKPASTKFQLWPVDLGGSAVCVILSAIVYVIGIQPLVDRRVEAAEARDRLNAHHKSELQLNAKHRELTQRLAAVRAVLPQHMIELQSVRQLNLRLDSLIQLARRFGMAIDEVRPGRSVAGPHFRKTTIHLIAKGGFQNCAKFLAEAHVRFRDVSVIDFELNANPTDRTPIARCRINLVWYTTLEPK